MRTHVRLAVATCALLTFFYLRSHLGAISERAADLKYPFQASIPFDDLKSVGSSGGGIVDTNVVSTETQIDSGSEKEMEQPNAVVDDWQAKDHDIVKAEEMVPSRNLTSANTTGAVAMEEIIPDKVIVMGKLKEQDTDWVAQELPDWSTAIYTVNDPTAALSIPINKGREANAYLTYIIEHYTRLPETMVFIHHHRSGYPEAWHTDAPNNDNVFALAALQIPHIQKEGYASLRCNLIPGCPHEVRPFRSNTNDVEKAMPQVWELFFNTTVPDVIAAPCCAQFAVSREQVLKRPLADYVKYREWLYDTLLEDKNSGRVMEYLWHVIFGKEAVHCPSQPKCYADVYGKKRPWSLAGLPGMRVGGVPS